MKNSIRKIISKIKCLGENKDFMIAALILLVGFGSFGLGRLSKIEEGRMPVRIEYPNTQAGAVANISVVTDKKFVASKNSTKYHHPWCSGAQRIKEENKVWFSSKKEAEKAGYTPAGNCKGL